MMDLVKSFKTALTVSEKESHFLLNKVIDNLKISYFKFGYSFKESSQLIFRDKKYFVLSVSAQALISICR